MKKFLLTLAVFFTTGFFLNFNTNAGCEQSLPNNLQACFNSIQQNQLHVVVDDDILYIQGDIDPQFKDEAQACIDEYNTNAASCPGAPVIEFGVPPSEYGTGIPGYNVTPTTVKNKRG